MTLRVRGNPTKNNLQSLPQSPCKPIEFPNSCHLHAWVPIMDRNVAAYGRGNCIIAPTDPQNRSCPVLNHPICDPYPFSTSPCAHIELLIIPFPRVWHCKGIVCIYIYIYICMYACLYVCMYVCVYVCMCMWFTYIYIYICKCIYIYIYVQMHVYICVYIDN